MEWREDGLERGNGSGQVRNGLDLITRTGIIISQTGGHVQSVRGMYRWSGVEWSGPGYLVSVL